MSKNALLRTSASLHKWSSIGFPTNLLWSSNPVAVTNALLTLLNFSHIQMISSIFVCMISRKDDNNFLGKSVNKLNAGTKVPVIITIEK